jgi:hypothetical protein
MGRRITSDRAWAAIPAEVKRAGTDKAIVVWAFFDALRQGEDGLTDYELAHMLGGERYELTKVRLTLIACDHHCGSCGREFEECDHAPGQTHHGQTPWLEDSGEKRHNDNENECIVWRLTPAMRARADTWLGGVG